MMFGNYNAYQPVGTPQQFAMDQMQQFQQRAQMQPGMQLIRVTGMDGAKAYQMPPNSVVPRCTTRRGIDSVNYNGAINTAAIQKTVTEQTQKVLDTITGNCMVDMQNQIDQLQLSQAMCGVVRYPNTFAYNAGPSPFCGNGCCGTANI